MAHHGLSDDRDIGDLAHYIVSVTESALMFSWPHHDVVVIERQVHHLKEDLKRSFQTTE